MKTLITATLLLTVALAFQPKHGRSHPDYVPNEVTAKRIARAVLDGQYGQERVNAQLPLRAISTGRGTWMVQGTVLDEKGRIAVGGGFAVLIDKNSGCLTVIEHTK